MGLWRTGSDHQGSAATDSSDRRARLHPRDRADRRPRSRPLGARESVRRRRSHGVASHAEQSDPPRRVEGVKEFSRLRPIRTQRASRRTFPARSRSIEPPNTGGLLRKGSSIALQLHYTTNGRATTDASEIGLWFYDDDEIPTERMSGDCACIFVKGWDPIPPYDPDHEMRQTITIPKDAYIYSMLPHMHFRGKRMRFYAEYPDGKTEELLNIAQLQLQLAARLPTGRAAAGSGRHEDHGRRRVRQFSPEQGESRSGAQGAVGPAELG